VQVLGVAAAGGQALVNRTVDVAGWSGASQPIWLKNGRDLITASRSFDESEENMQLRELSTVTGRTRDLTNGLYGYHGASLTASEDKLVTVRLDRETSFWFASTPDLRDGRVRSGDSGRYDRINWTEDGQILAQAKRGNGVDIWLIDPNGGEPKIMTDGRSVHREPVWLPRHRSFVLASHREGTSGIWRFDLKDASYHLLASSDGYVEMPSCSPDGTLVYYTAWDLNSPSIWVAQSEKGTTAPQRLVVDARYPIVSPDGKSMAVEFVDKSTKSGWRISVLDLRSLEVKANFPQILSGSRLRWMPDSSGLTFVETDDQEASNILLQNLSDPLVPPHPLTDFHENQIFDYAWSPDGKRLVCLKGHVSSDAFLLVRKESWIGSRFAR
jgi:Tol biopolymer transport system component